MRGEGLDDRRAEAFAEEMLGVLAGGALSLMLSLGHRAGLFDVLAALPPSRPEAVAEAAGLHAPTVRAWLATMATGGVVELDAESGTYRLPPEHAAVLTRAGACGGLASCAQWIPMLAAAEEPLLACLESGGGVPGGVFERFQAVRDEQSERAVARPLLGALVPLVPGLEASLRRGIDVLELGCGSGRVLQRLAHAFPASRFRGIDVAPEAVVAARSAAAGLANASFELRDPAELDETASVDWVAAFGSLPSLARPEAALARVLRALRPGGALLVQDLAVTGDPAQDADHPLAPFFYTIASLHSGPVSLAGGGTGTALLWGRERLREALERAGFVGLETHALPGDDAHLYHVARRPG